MIPFHLYHLPPLSFFFFFLLALTLTLAPLATARLPTGLNTTVPDYRFSGSLSSSLLSSLRPACVTAYTSPITCPPSILISPSLTSEKRASLSTICKPSCASSLLSYSRGVRSSCPPLNELPNDTWLESAADGEAVLDLYWANCLRPTTNASESTNKLCDISTTDFQIAWDAAVDESNGGRGGDAVRAFCDDACLVQLIVLMAPTKQNLDDLERMCRNSDNVKEMPFIEALEFAGRVRRDAGQDGKVVSTGVVRPGGGNGTAAENELIGSGAGRVSVSACTLVPPLLLLVTTTMAVFGIC